ncbi:hypothetical protein SVAN01_07792 [Stagonosporopsis vannaccii]|nr:hypothetical protein SVAN01_07792 [Stagonosporopsis vannaccii]
MPTSHIPNTHLAVPAGPAFIASSLFTLLEQIASAHEPDQASLNLLWKMLQELEKFHIVGHCRLKAYVECHSDAVRKVRRLCTPHAESGRTARNRLLFNGTRFRDLTRAYFEVVNVLEEELN